MAAVDNFKSWSRKQGVPATIGLLASLIVAALLFWFSQMRGVETFALSTDSLSRPWSFITYAWTAMPLTDPISIIFFIFLIMWMFTIGGSLERQMGAKSFISLWFILVVFSGLVIFGASHLLEKRYVLAGPYLPEVAMAVLWCARNQGTRVCLWGIPIEGKWLAVLLAVITLLTYGSSAPLLGGFALIPLAAGWFYGLGKLPQMRDRRRPEKVKTTRGQVTYDDSYFDDVRRREKEREEREKLRKLFEGSLSDDEGR